MRAPSKVKEKGFREAQDGGRSRAGPGGKVLAVLLAVGGLGLLALGSQFPVRTDPANESLLRFSWRLRGEESEECRPLSAAELERLPIHMRNPDACQGRVLPYLLTVTVDGQVAVEREFSPAGVRGNRPIYVLEDLPMDPGDHTVDVRFEQVAPEGGELSPSEPGSEVGSTLLTLATRMTLRPGDIGLISYDRDANALVQLSPAR